MHLLSFVVILNNSKVCHLVVWNAVPVTPFSNLVFDIFIFASVNEDISAIREEDPNGDPVLLVIVFVGKTENLRLRRRLPPGVGGAIVAEITERHG
jgi:hypothetical protein